MKAADFRYERPETLTEALALMADGEASPLAGGQSLMPMMNFRLATPETLIDLNSIPGLAGVREADGWVEIGAMTRYAELERADLIAGRLPLMAKSLPHIAHAAVRNRGTLGGSLALCDPAAEMPAVLLALGGEVVVEGPDGRRRISADNWGLGLYETARAPEELVVALRAPTAKPGQRCGFYELARRHGDYAMAGVAITADAGLEAVRIALFGVSDKAVRATDAEAALAGGDGGAAALDAAVAALSEIEFHGDTQAGPETRRHLAGVALRRAWTEVTA